MAQQSAGDAIVDSFRKAPREAADRATLGPQRREASSSISQYEDRAKAAVGRAVGRAKDSYNRLETRLEDNARKSNARRSGR